jgi:hypothetical protein
MNPIIDVAVNGAIEPYYEKAVMKFLDIGKIKKPAA